MQNGNSQEREQRVSDLILQIARQKGFGMHELKDAVQQVYFEIMEFKFDPLKAGETSERTILGGLIDRKLTMIQRTEMRRRNNLKKIRRVCGRGKFEPIVDGSHLEHEQRFELGVDIRNAVAALPPREQEICNALSKGTSRNQIAKRLGITRHEVDRIVGRIADQFEQKNIDQWVR